jgi:hypothetical protein
MGLDDRPPVTDHTPPLWRLLVRVILVSLCLEGVVTLALYSFKGHAFVLLVKDGLLAMAYIAFVVWARRERRHWRWPLTIVVPLIALVALSVAELFNPALENVSVALVGIRTRLLYMPLAVLGYFLFVDRHDVEDFVLLFAVPSIPVSLFGVVQYALGPHAIATWGSGFAASVWTVGTFHGEAVYRPASTFSFTGHFANYLLVATLLTAAVCIWGQSSTTRRWIFRISLVSQGLGVMVSGARLVLLFVPVGIGALWLAAAIRRRWLESGPPWSPALGWTAGLTMLGLLIGALIAPSGVYRAQSIVAPSVNRQLNIVDTLDVSMRRVQSLSGTDLLWGHGLGSASPGARYVIKDPERFITTGPFEGALGQYIWETGVPGVILFAVVWLGMLGHGAVRAIRIRDPLLWCVAAAIVLLNVFIFMTSGTYALMTYAPTSIYFWLFLGILLRLPELDSPSAFAHH